MSEDLIPVAKSLFLSKLFPNVQNEHGAFAICQYGKELGVGPMTSLQTMAIIKGKICMGAQVMLSLACGKGVRYKVVKDTATESEVEFTREGFSPYLSSFTMEDAKRAGVYRQDSGWDKYPKDMLYWRAVTRGLRRIAPDVILGLYAKEEIEDAPALEAKIVQEPPKEEDVPNFPVPTFLFPVPPEPPPEEPKKNFKFLQAMGVEKKRIGDSLYYETLKVYGFAHANEIDDRERQKAIYLALKDIPMKEV